MSKYLIGSDCMWSNMRTRIFLSVPWVMIAMSWFQVKLAMSVMA